MAFLLCLGLDAASASAVPLLFTVSISTSQEAQLLSFITAVMWKQGFCCALGLDWSVYDLNLCMLYMALPCGHLLGCNSSPGEAQTPLTCCSAPVVKPMLLLSPGSDLPAFAMLWLSCRWLCIILEWTERIPCCVLGKGSFLGASIFILAGGDGSFLLGIADLLLLL